MVIRVLSTQLANQIAAGEVVERPASVVKELIENSIDAGATRIDVDIELGGSTVIRVRDNGCGINKDELPLALARHATSKIAHLDDLAAIASLGFRGEALASISSVSRLTLTSRTANQSEAWQVYVEGRDMQATLKPAAHPVGSTVEVRDLFYNTPARRRFLKTDKTEFTHIDETLKKIALACVHITINLQHNGKLIRQYQGVSDKAEWDRRLVAVCGRHFMAQAMKFEWEHGDLKIYGWVELSSRYHCQYFYVNHRIVKDRIVNHAIKQAYAQQHGDTVAYVIYLELDPHQVDVNVHPTKHEVRFHEARLIHDFVYQALLMTIHTHGSTLPEEKTTAWLNQPINRQAAGKNVFAAIAEQTDKTHYKTLREPRAKNLLKAKQEQMIYQSLLNDDVVNTGKSQAKNEIVANALQTKYGNDIDSALFPKHTEPFILTAHAESASTFGHVIGMLSGEYAILQKNDELQLLSLKNAQVVLYRCKLIEQIKKPAEKLLITLSLTITNAEKTSWQHYKELLDTFNIQFDINNDKIHLLAIPRLLQNMDWQPLIPLLSVYLQKSNVNGQSLCHEMLAGWFASHYIQFNKMNKKEKKGTQIQVVTLLTELDQLTCSQALCSTFLQKIDLTKSLALLNSQAGMVNIA